MFANFKPVSNYTVWLGTNKLATTNGTSARVSYPLGTAPTFQLRANLTDGQSLEFGTFTFPQPHPFSAILSVDIEATTNLFGAWKFMQRLTTVLGPEQFADTSGFFRCSMAILPLATNSAAITFNRNTLLITNTP